MASPSPLNWMARPQLYPWRQCAQPKAPGWEINSTPSHRRVSFSFPTVRTEPDKPELRRMLAVGSPRLSDEDMARFGALPEALAEAQSVAEKFRYHTVISGDRATRAAVRRELSNGRHLSLCRSRLGCARERRAAARRRGRQSSGIVDGRRSGIRQPAEMFAGGAFRMLHRKHPIRHAQQTRQSGAPVSGGGRA